MYWNTECTSLNYGSPRYPALLMKHLIAIERSVMTHPMYQRIRGGFSSN